MTGFKGRLPRISRRGQLAAGAAVLLALGAAAGASAISLTRPAVEMAPTIVTPMARLAASSGIVTVKGRVSEIFGDRVVMQDQTGRAMIDAGRGSDTGLAMGQTILVQGRYDEGQLRAAYLVGPDGQVRAVGLAERPPHGPGPDGPGRLHEGPPPPPGEQPARGGVPTASVPPVAAPAPEATGAVAR